MVRLLDIAFESRRTFTQDEFFRFCVERESDVARYELLDGKIVMNPPAGYPHGGIAGNVVLLLKTFVKARGLGKVFESSQGFELPSGDTVAPDGSFVSNATWEAAPPPVPGKFLGLVPDLVVEIRSQSNTAADMEQKRAIYEKNGVREYWFLEPRKREAQFHTLKAGKLEARKTLQSGDVLESRVLSGLQVPVAEIFEE